jgi:mannosyltransferase OCH1-like enzyme
VIPRLIFRSVPEETSEEVEQFWAEAVKMHAGWKAITYRDPIDPERFPISSPHWERCTSGAQRAGLIRLEGLLNHGGIWIDSDVEVFRPFDSLLGVAAFAGWEDAKVVPDAILGAKPAHPAIGECLERAIEVLDQGPWASGPGVTTAILPGRADVLLLPPGALFPYHYTERHRRHEDHRAANPWAFCAHHWEGSWLR